MHSGGIDEERNRVARLKPVVLGGRREYVGRDGTQRPVVGVEGRRVVVGREGAPALVGLGTSVLGFKDGRRRLAAVCCQLMVFLRQSLGLSRGVDEGETDECRLDPRVRKESRCHRGSGRVSVGGVHGVGRRYPEVPVFKQF